MKIGNKFVGTEVPCYIIAEIGVNHNGNIELAKILIDEAVKSGADAVKFQTFKTEKLVTEYAKMAEYQKANLKKDSSQFEMLKKLELSYEDFSELKEYCDIKNTTFLSTPFDIESAKFLNSIGVEAFKVSSGDLTNIPLIEYINSFNKPIIISTGMANFEEINDAYNVIEDKNNLAILHCTSNYPAPFDSLNLNVLKIMKEKFNSIVGYSDHTEGIIVPSTAVALGAKIIEKHFTVDKSMEGPDHKASIEPKEFKEMVNNIRIIEMSLGSSEKVIQECEISTTKVARKSIVAARNINKGDMITIEDLDYKRPGTGLSPKYYKDLVGMVANTEIKKNEQIDFEMINN